MSGSRLSRGYLVAAALCWGLGTVLEQVRAEWVRCRISSHTLLIPSILPGMGLFWCPIAQAWKAAQPRVSQSP